MDNKRDYYASLWGLTVLDLLEETSRGHIFKVQRNGSPEVLKLFTGEGIEEERRGAEFLEICKGRGVVDVLRSDDDALLMGFCDGPGLETLVTDGKDFEATEVIVNILNKIHACPIPKKHKLVKRINNSIILFFKINSPKKGRSPNYSIPAFVFNRLRLVFFLPSHQPY